MEITLKDVSKKYGDFEALKEVSLTFEEGKFYGLLGPNGAGKTTLFNLLIQLFQPSSGSISWQTGTDSKNLYETIGVVFQNGKLDDKLTVLENLLCRGAMYGMTKSDVLKKIDTFDAYLNLSTIIKRKYGHLSGGQKRKVDIARALMNDPKLLLLDEPTTGLDPEARNELWQAIAKLNKDYGLTVVLITHYLEEMKDCDTLNILIRGSLYYSGPVDAFIEKHSSTALILELKEQATLNQLALSRYASQVVRMSPQKIKITDLSVQEMLALLAKNQSSSLIEKFYVDYSNLEAAYLNLLKEKVGDTNE